VITVVVPVYQSASTLLEVVARITDALKDTPFEIIFVDDASPDESAAIIAQMSGPDPRIRLVRHERNRGQNMAVVTGFASASGDLVAVLDADLQDPPEALPDLLRHKRQHTAQVVFATRRGVYAGALRTITSRLYKKVLSRLTQLPYGAGLFMIVDRDVAQRVAAMAPIPSVVAAIGVMGLRTADVPVVRTARNRGGSAYRALDRISLAARTLRWLVAQR
jgi:polyisoprenyl-phosphate glycosyltransferase